MKENSPQWVKLRNAGITPKDVIVAYNRAIESMSTLNLCAARLMHKYEAHAATDITGFGILGHAANLAQHQNLNVDFAIQLLPCMLNTLRMCKILGQNNLKNARAVETSGGLLIALSVGATLEFIEEFQRESGCCAWIVGLVMMGKGNAFLVKKWKTLNVQ